MKHSDYVNDKIHAYADIYYLATGELLVKLINGQLLEVFDVKMNEWKELCKHPTDKAVAEIIDSHEWENVNNQKSLIL